jgi:hypothetical protein
MSQLQAIAYVSSATQRMSHEQLESLLVDARDLNLESKVTGVLLYNDGNFMQYFEGEPDAMRVTYERILASRRHRDITEIMNEPVAHRSFPDWLMGFSEPTASELLSISTASWRRSVLGSPEPALASDGLALLLGFWQHCER